MTLTLAGASVIDRIGAPNLKLRLCIAGALAAALSISVSYFPMWLHGFPFFPGTIFGALISVVYALSGCLRHLWKAVAITVTSTLAYYLSFLTAAGIELHNPFFRGYKYGLASDPALFVAGVGGALVIFCGVPILLNPRGIGGSHLLRALCWSPLGGILGALGSRLGPSLGITVWSVVNFFGLTAPGETRQNAMGQTCHMYSLWVVWQTGIGFALGFMSSQGNLRGSPH